MSSVVMGAHLRCLVSQLGSLTAAGGLRMRYGKARLARLRGWQGGF